MKTFHHPIAFYPHLARELEEIPAAIFFQQLLYWSTRCGRDDGWIYKSKDDMEEETTLTREQQDRIRKKLIEKGWIEEKVMKNPAGTPTMHYRCLVTISVAVEPTGVKPTGREGGLVENPQVLDRSETHKSLYSTKTTSETTLPGFKKPEAVKETEPLKDSPESDHTKFIKLYTEAFQKQFGEKYSFDGKKDGPAVKRVLTLGTPEKVVEILAALWNKPDVSYYVFDSSCYIHKIPCVLNSIKVAGKRPPKTGYGKVHPPQVSAKDLKDGEWMKPGGLGGMYNPQKGGGQ